LIEPIQAMAELADFQPDLIILDMYMPACTGTELAKVIRHNDRYVSVPIIYLSAEDDLDKQLDAMSEGGDDFLTKPIKPRHLITTVRNRAARARNLKARMVRDSLTGLYNHTHILQLLEDCSFRARRENKPLSFAMLDIDHFKRVNDSHGHPMGDRVIKSLALFLKQRCARPTSSAVTAAKSSPSSCPTQTLKRPTGCSTKYASALPKFTTRRNPTIFGAPSAPGWSSCANTRTA
jgi:PleD family two-component response regulator